jgi:serine/threonine protein kinase
MLSRLKHPCIVPIYGFSRAAGGCTQAIVIKYMPNGLFGDVIRRVKQGKPPAFWTHTRIAIIVCGIIVRLELIHSKRTIPRDLKPANGLIDRHGRSRIGDFDSLKFIVGAISLSTDFRGSKRCPLHFKCQCVLICSHSI